MEGGSIAARRAEWQEGLAAGTSVPAKASTPQAAVAPQPRSGWAIVGARFVASLDRGSATLFASLLPIIRHWPQWSRPPWFITASKQARLQGLIVGSRREQRDMVRAVDACGFRPVIDRSFPLDGLAEAFRYQESGAHFGKICLEF